ncbi:MAG: FAD-binding protein [Patescibacteria group bacterium]|nr:FAD-binding protein [Patescibacteria group bacterium]MCL5095119.1 FAD-binding protein [Patescibacteria group bacterium]
MTDNLWQKLEDKLGLGKVKVKESLVLHTTFQIGGPADYYFEAKTNEELIKAYQAAKDLRLPFLILGGGSNVLIGDKGFRGLVVKNKTKGIKIVKVRGKIGPSLNGVKLNVKDVLVEVEAGVPFNQFVRFAIDEGLGGLEEFLGLPGTVGGAVIGNAHWQDKTVSQFIFSQKTHDLKILLSVIFQLQKEDTDFLWQKARWAIEHRQKTQPTGASAGCIFKNIKKSQALRIGTADLTTSAGFVIEASGLKGEKFGNLQISPQHANFMINLGGAKAKDVLNLIKEVKEKVKEKFNLELEEEIVKIGEF